MAKLDSTTIYGSLVASGLAYPTNDGISGQTITTDGLGNLSFETNITKYDNIGDDLKGKSALATTVIDYSASGVYTKTLAANTTFTISNLQLNKSIVLVISGDFTIAFPSYIKFINGTYDGTVSNYIKLHCTNSTTSSEEVWATISKGI